MATKIVTKNSSTASAVPTASDLVQGELAVNVADKRLFTEDNSGAIVELGTNPSGNVTFQDNGKAIFGAGSDLQIYHDGDSSYISHNTTGTDLVVEATSPGDDVIVRAADDLNFRVNGNENGIVVVGEGATSLYHANSQKLATTSTGIDVTGTATMDGLEIGDNQWIYAGNGADLKIGHDGTDNIIRAQGSPLYIDANGTTFRGYSPYTKHMDIASNGDISFYEDTGTTPKFFWDASAESLELGSFGDTGRRATFHGSNILVDGAGASEIIIGDGNVAYMSLQTTDDATALKVRNYSGSSDLMTIERTSGNVGIGTSSPATTLTVEGSGANGIELNRNGADATQSARLFFDSSTSGYAVTNVAGALTFNSGATAGSSSGTERMRIDSAGNLLVGSASSDAANDGIRLKSYGQLSATNNNDIPLSLNRRSSDGTIAQFRKDNSVVGSIGTSNSDLVIGTADTNLWFDDGANAFNPASSMTLGASNGVIDLGSSGRRFKDLWLSGTYHVNSGGTGKIQGTNDASYFPIIGSGTSGSASIYLNGATRSGFAGHLQFAGTNTVFFNETLSQERMRIDSSGNLLIGKTTTGVAGAGIVLRGGGELFVTRAGDVMNLNRLSTDGEILAFRKDGTAVGSVSCGNSGAYIYFGSSAESVGLGYGGGFVFPTNGATAGSDNSKDLGSPSYRWDDIYATNGTIQTSDRNEKQDIEALSDAEQRVAVAAKGLLRKFRWKDSVSEKGDEARVHFGIIAQDLQAAFAAEGLDAGDYAMFISTTWTDEETNEEKTRMGVRYSELLAFIIAAL